MSGSDEEGSVCPMPMKPARTRHGYLLQHWRMVEEVCHRLGTKCAPVIVPCCMKSNTQRRCAHLALAQMEESTHMHKRGRDTPWEKRTAEVASL